MTKLELEAKSDRELLLLTASKVNDVDEKLDKLCEKVTGQETRITENTLILWGKDEDPGLVKKMETQEKNYHKLNKQFWIVVSALVASGALGGAVFKLIEGL